MKKIMMLIMLFCLMVTPVFAGLVADSGFDNYVEKVNNLGNGDNFYDYSEYVSGMWVSMNTNTIAHTLTSGGNPGNCVQMMAGYGAVGSVTDNGGASTGNSWAYTVDLQNYNSGIKVDTTITLLVQGLPDPWSGTGWKNRVTVNGWSFIAGVGDELASISIDPTTVGSGWTTYSGTINLGSGYEYLSIGVRVENVGTASSNLRVDNLDILPIPEPALLGLLGLGILGFIRRK